MADFAKSFFNGDFPMRGRHLIAASAGTGKTYNMQNVFARLVMLEGLRVSQILVVTFTEAATAELCDRLRRVLAGVRDFLVKDRDLVFAEDVERLNSAQRQAWDLAHLIPTADWGMARDRVVAALADFDQAAISTIHGFCNRVLNRYAFESGTNFAAEVGDFDDACTLAGDAWRRLGMAEKAFFAKYGKDSFCPGVERLAKTHAALDKIENQGEGPEQSRLVFSCADAVRTRQKSRRCDARNLSYDDLLLQVRDALRKEGEQLSAKLREEYAAVLIDEFQDTDPVQYEIFHRIFWEGDIQDTCRSFVVGDPKQAIYSFRGGDIFTYRKAVSEIARERHYELKKNFRSTGGIIAAVNRMFRDTDGNYTFGDSSIAYAGDLAFCEKIRPLRTNGKDDETPFRVIETTDAVWTCGKGEILRQIQHLLNEEAPEIHDAKNNGYRALQASDIAVLVSSNAFGREVCQALIDGEVPAVCMADASVFESDSAKNILSLMQMLSDPSYTRQVRGGIVGNVLWGLTDALVLQLSQEGDGIPLPAEWNGEELRVVSQGRFSMIDLTRFLESLYAQWSERGFGAMFSTFAERTGLYRRLPRLRAGERMLTDVGQLLELIQAYENENGVNPVLEMGWFAERIATASESNEDEQQRLESDENAVVVTTIHKAKGLEYPVVFVPITKGAWLPRWKKDGTLDGRQWLDWNHRMEFKPEYYEKTQFAYYHDEKELALHAFSRMDDGHRDSARNRKAMEEIKAEHLRLLYVSFTRAAQRCIVITHHGTDTQCDELLEKLRGDEPCPSALFVVDSAEGLVNNGEGEIGLGNTTPPKDINSSEKDDGELKEPLALPNLLHDEDVGSYSMLAPKHGTIDIPASEPDDGVADEADWTLETDYSVSRIYGAFGEEARNELPIFRLFPGGTGNGTLFHSLFEKIPLSVIARADEPDPLVLASVRSILGGVRAIQESPDDGEAMQSVLRMLRGVAKVQLPVLVEGGASFSLGDVALEKQLHEWKFDFSSAASKEKTDALFSVIEEFWNGVPAKRVFVDAIHQCTTFERIPNGWITGAVDLLFEHGGRFYVVDFQKNVLGAYRSEFGPEGLAREMARKFYFLQYLVYSAVVHRYLSECLPDYSFDRHFGGVHYVFVRAFAFDGAGAADAVFSDRPSRELLEAVGNVLGLKGE